MFGACFGHQAIAAALGGTVGYNPDGWVLGTVETRDTTRNQTRLVYGAHKEQVVTLPLGAAISESTPGCLVAGFTIEDHVLTTQYHPEMTDGFIAALVDEMAKDMPNDVIAAARTSLSRSANRGEAIQQIITFFEGI
jgi:GMP synthase-like glutamine amidotransferase